MKWHAGYHVVKTEGNQMALTKISLCALNAINIMHNCTTSYTYVCITFFQIIMLLCTYIH